MSRTFTKMIAVAALGLCPLLGHAQGAPSAQDQLKAFVKNVTGATGSFRQSTTTTQGRAQTPQSGAFSFSRPGKFKWAVKTPYEQVIVSDGKQVYQYDPDLAQVTQRQVDQAIGTSPAAILFGSGSLDASFNVTSLPAKDGLAWLRAKPRNADAGFSQVDIGFTNNQPARIELLDTFGQTTRVELSGWTPNPSLPASEFQFTAPAGVDVVKM